MSSVSPRERRRLSNSIKDQMRELGMQLSLLSHQVSGKLGLKDVDLDCLDIVARYGPLSPSSLAKHAGLHPATMTGVLDRLERAGWIQRERDPQDRRGVLISGAKDRGAEIFGLYAGMNSSLDEICDSYAEEELKVLLDFLSRTADAGRRAADKLAEQ